MKRTGCCPTPAPASIPGEANVTLREVLLDNKLVFSKPQDRLFAGPIDRMDRFALRYRARKFQSEQYRMPWSGLRGQRTSLIPHQLNIAPRRWAVVMRHASCWPMKWVLGKTIEAGMILHQQLLSGAAERVLIVVRKPFSTSGWWKCCAALTCASRCLTMSATPKRSMTPINPFETEQLVICSLGFRAPRQAASGTPVRRRWDLMVVDEAHHRVWSEDAPSREYQTIEQLAECVPGILLLTATPEQLGMESHLRACACWIRTVSTISPSLSKNSRTTVRLPTLSPAAGGQQAERYAELNALSDLIGERDIEPLLQAANSDRDDARAAPGAGLVLMDRHGTSRVLFRNTRNGVKGFPETQAAYDSSAAADPVPDRHQSFRHYGCPQNRGRARPRHALSGADLSGI